MVWHLVVTARNQDSHHWAQTPGHVHLSSLMFHGPAGKSSKAPSFKRAMILTCFRDCNDGVLLSHNYFASRTDFRTKV